MRALTHELRLFFVALQFLSRIPAPRWTGFEPHWLNTCVRHFPLAGAVIGAAGALVLWAAQALWPPGVAAVLAVAATVWLTAAFHEDGLADTFDALLGAAGRDQALAIMKDSRIGSYGAAALILVLGVRAALLAALLGHGWQFAATALVASHVLARAAAVALMLLLPYAGGDAEHAKAKPLARSVARRDAVAAAGWCVLPLLLVGSLATAGRAAAAAAAAVLVVLAMRRWLDRRLGGYTGDTLGATEQLCEVAVLLALAATW